MGIFDRLKKRSEQPKQPEKRMKTIYSMPTPDGEEIMLFNIERVNSIQHRNGEVTDLMMARITKQNSNDTIFVDDAHYITFEVPQGMEMNDELINTVMSHYRPMTMTYIGRLIDNRNGYAFGNKSKAVNEISEVTVLERISEKQKSVEQSRQVKQQAEENRRKEFLENIDARRYLDEFEQERNRRKQSPTLRSIYTSNGRQGARTHTNYDGINIETGDILRMRQVEKVGKDGSGTYLYSAYIHNTPNEYDVELIGEKPQGFAVCFELQKRLEDIVRDGNIDEITQVLQLLSDERNFENSNQLSYIGEIDKNGQVNRKEISSSPAIRSTIIKMQKQFAENIKTQQQGIQEQ